MIRLKTHIALMVLIFALSLPATPLYAKQKFGTGAFPNTSVIEKHLKRGVSTKSDVQRFLGVPNGIGQSNMGSDFSRLATLGQGPRKIWYYDDIETTDMKSENGVVKMNLRQQILLIFFKGEFFDGFLWTSNKYQPKSNKF